MVALDCFPISIALLLGVSGAIAWFFYLVFLAKLANARFSDRAGQIAGLITISLVVHYGVWSAIQGFN